MLALAGPDDDNERQLETEIALYSPALRCEPFAVLDWINVPVGAIVHSCRSMGAKSSGLLDGDPVSRRCWAAHRIRGRVGRGGLLRTNCSPDYLVANSPSHPEATTPNRLPFNRAGTSMSGWGG